MGVSIEHGSVTTTLSKLTEVNEKIRAALLIVTDTAAKLMEEYAKENAPWTDRTGNARQMLKGDAYWEDSTKLVCALQHQVEYGIWLELAMEKKYAILEKAIASRKDQLVAQYKKIAGDIV